MKSLALRAALSLDAAGVLTDHRYPDRALSSFSVTPAAPSSSRLRASA